MRLIAFHPQYNSRNKRDVSGAFAPECRRFMSVHEASSDDIFAIDNRRGRPARKRQVLEILERYRDRELDGAAFFCHGHVQSMQLGFSRRDVAPLARAIAAACGRTRPVVPLYLCSVGGGERQGASSFADALRDALCGYGAVHCRVMGHATVAHTTKNPHAVFFDGNGSPTGGVGGYDVVTPRSPLWSAWRKALQGKLKGQEELRFRFPFMEPGEIHAALSGTPLSVPAPRLPAEPPEPLRMHVVDRVALMRGGPPGFRSRGRTIPFGTELFVLQRHGEHVRAVGIDGRDFGWTKAENLAAEPKAVQVEPVVPQSPLAKRAAASASTTVAVSARLLPEDVYTVIDPSARIRGGPTAFRDSGKKIPRYERIRVLDRRGQYCRLSGLGGSDYQWTHADNLHLFFKDVFALQQVALPPPHPIALGPRSARARRPIVELHNRLGGLIAALSAAAEIDAAAAYAVWLVESGGRAHEPQKAVIRFENHLFFRAWGKAHAAAFDRRFRFGGHRGTPGKSWTNHEVKLERAFIEVHRNQTREYATLELARALAGDVPALSSISIGGPQILVSHYRRLGYESPRAMYDAFQQSERAQVLGFFDFCSGPKFDGALLSPLRRKDFVTFARSYNGAGKAELYAERIQAAFELARAVASSRPPSA